MTELAEATDYTRKVARELWATTSHGAPELLARALATPALVEPEDPDDLLADAYVRQNWPVAWTHHARMSDYWTAARAGIRIARENPL